MNERAYLESGGSICPDCGSSNIEGGSANFDGDYCWANVFCHDCDFEWRDIYKLVGMEKR